MTGCDTHGELLGGYILGALSDQETEFMRRHLETCSACAREYAALQGLPALLDRIEPADVPPPLPSPALEEAVLDRWTREHRRTRRPDAGSHAGGRGRNRGWRPFERRAGSRTRRGPSVARVATGVVAVLAATIVALAIWLPSDDPYAHGSLAGMTSADGNFTVEQVPTGTRVYLEADRLPRDAYEVWCVRSDGRWISGGSFRPDATGRAAVTLTAAVDPGDYHTVIVTKGSVDDERGPEVLRGDLIY